ncbi:10951_t:CDS:2, partial [Paraglomus occultum]
SNLGYKELWTLVEEGLQDSNLLKPYKYRKETMEKNRRKEFEEYKKKMIEWAEWKLEQHYSILNGENPKNDLSHIEDDPNYTDCYQHHKHFCQQVIRELEVIDDSQWKSSKIKFILASNIARKSLVDYQGNGSLFFAIYNKKGKSKLTKFLSNLINQDKRSSGETNTSNEAFSNINDYEDYNGYEGTDGSNRYKLLIKAGKAVASFVGWPVSSEDSEQNSLKTFLNEEIEAAEQDAANITDIDFVLKLYGDQDFPVFEFEMESIKDEFLKSYKIWKTAKNWATLLNSQANRGYYRTHSVKYQEETEAMYKNIANDLALKLESMYSKGNEIVMTELKKSDSYYPRYTLSYTITIDEPSYNELTINEIKLDTYECGRVKQNPNFLPTPKAYAERVLRISDEVYDIRQ